MEIRRPNLCMDPPPSLFTTFSKGPLLYLAAKWYRFIVSD